MTPPFRVVVTDFLTDELTIERETLGDIATLEKLNVFAESELVGTIETADAIMMYHNFVMTATTIDRLERCRLIVRCGVGFDNIDRVAARSRGIPIANVPDYGTEEVADSAIALVLSLMRGVSQLNSRLRRGVGVWSYLQIAPLTRLRGQVFGIIGLGRIGMATALRAKACGFDVAFYDPYLGDGLDKALGIRRVETLEGLLSQSNVISVHCPLSPQTKHLLNTQTLLLLPRGAYLVNTSRGAVVDTSCLPELLASGHLAGAGIDVLAQEPPSETDPLLVAWRDPNHVAHDRLIVNPHAAFYSEQGFQDMRRKGALACRHALLGEPLRNIVN